MNSLCLSLISGLVLVVAVRGTFVEVDTYTTSAACSGTPVALFYQQDTCVADITASTKLTASGSGWTQNTYSGTTTCTGTPITSVTYNSTCSALGSTSTQASVASGSFVEYDMYTNTADCSGAVTLGPSYFKINQCIGLAGVASTKYVVNGNTLGVCVYSTGDCSGTAQGCGSTSITSGQCIGGSKYTFASGSASVAPAVGIVLLATLVGFFSRA